jgi:hypothetical protein
MNFLTPECATASWLYSAKHTADYNYTRDFIVFLWLIQTTTDIFALNTEPIVKVII